MPVNIFQGQTAEFTVQFTDINSNVITPSSATMSIIYTDLNGLTASSCMAMVLTDPTIWTVSWQSSVSGPCVATYIINANNTINVPTQQGTFRVIQEQ